MSTVFLFPGQGSQHPEMLHILPDHPAVVRTLREASELLGQDVNELDSEAALQSTVSVQVALFTAGVAVARALQQEGIPPAAVAGLSVGAFAAAVISGAVHFADGLMLVRQRATLMENAFPRGYGLAAIVGLSEPQVSSIVAQFHTRDAPVFVGNINSPVQIVVVGSDSSINRVLEEATARGARKAERLAIAVPSHCPLLQPVADALRSTLRGMHLQRPAIPYVGNVRARALRSGEAIADDLAANIAHGVRWYDVVRVLTELGGKFFVEMHPGHVLRDLVSEDFPAVRAVAMETTSICHLRKLARQST